MRRALSVAALAICGSALHAQGGPPIPDSVTAGAPPRAALSVRDTLKPPFPTADAAGIPAHGRLWRWDGDEIFQWGATSLAELLEHVPGVRVMRSGSILAPHVVVWNGDPGRVRVFVDGTELNGLDSRAGRAHDLARVPIWNLEEVLVEAAPGELRVHLRTWRVERTTPFTRVDVLTGDAETNLYRGFFGRRFQSGLGLQFGFEQMGTTTRDRGGDGDGLSMFARVGAARADWSVDLVGQRVRVTRNATLRDDDFGAVPSFTGGPSLTYLRVAFGSPDRGRGWLQLTGAALSHDEASPIVQLPPAFGVVPSDSADTTRFQAQYAVAGGLRAGALAASGGARYRRMEGEGTLAPYFRAGWVSERASLTTFVERSPADSVFRTDAALSVKPLSWLALTASASRRDPIGGDGGDAETIARAEAQLSVWGASFTGGVITRDTTRTAAIPVFNRGITEALASAATGVTFAAHLPVYRALAADVTGTRWESQAVYRPIDEVRVRLGLDTEWRSRFPRGDFTVRAYGTLHQYSGWFAPTEDGVVAVAGVRVYSTLLELRIRTATITWEFRNAAGARYETVPGYAMPRIINLYGVRWRFSN